MDWACYDRHGVYKLSIIVNDLEENMTLSWFMRLSVAFLT